MSNYEENTIASGSDTSKKEVANISSSQVVMASSAKNGILHLKIGNELLNASYSFQSKDLIINFGNNCEILIIKYLSQARIPSLVSETGQFLSKDTIFTITKFESGTLEEKQDIGSITSVTGTSIIRKANGAKGVISEYSAINVGDMLATTNQSKATITFADGMIAELNPSTKISIDRFNYSTDPDSFNIGLTVLEGNLNFQSGKIANTENAEVLINTPVSILRIHGDVTGGWSVDEDGTHHFSAKSNDKNPNSALEVRTLSGAEFINSESALITSNSVLTPPSIIVGEVVMSQISTDNAEAYSESTAEEKIQFNPSNEESNIISSNSDDFTPIAKEENVESKITDLKFEEITPHESEEVISEVHFEDTADDFNALEDAPKSDTSTDEARSIIEINDNFEAGETHDVRNVIELQKIHNAASTREIYGFTELDASTPSNRLIEIDGIDYKKLQFRKTGIDGHEDLIIEILGDDGSGNHSLVLKEFFAQKESSVTTFRFAAKS